MLLCSIHIREEKARLLLGIQGSARVTTMQLLLGWVGKMLRVAGYFRVAA